MDIYHRGRRSKQHALVSSFEKLAATDCRCIRHAGIHSISSHRLCIASPKSSYKHAILRTFARDYSAIKHPLLFPDSVECSIFGQVANPDLLRTSHQFRHTSVNRSNIDVATAADLLYSSKLLSNLYFRELPTCPDRVLDAPGMVDDFYLSLVDWGKLNNIISVALNSSVYLWDAQTSEARELVSIDPENLHNHYISSIKWNKAPHCSSLLAFGTSSGSVQLWNVQTETLVSTLQYPLYPTNNPLQSEISFPARISSISWNDSNVLSYGRRDGMVIHMDLRTPSQLSFNHCTKYHQQEVCGLSWSPCGSQLAMGGNDNILTIWDARMLSRPLHNIQEHTAAVKALSWCPTQRRTLASGGGTSDRTIRIWNTLTGHCHRKVTTNSQVTGLLWIEGECRSGELISSHGYSDSNLTVWRAPSLTKLGDMKAHHGRILAISSSPDYKKIVSAGSDERLCFWSIYKENHKRFDRRSQFPLDEECSDHVGTTPNKIYSRGLEGSRSRSHHSGFSISPRSEARKKMSNPFYPSPLGRMSRSASPIGKFKDCEYNHHPTISPIVSPKYQHISCKIALGTNNSSALVLIR